MTFVCVFEGGVNMLRPRRKHLHMMISILVVIFIPLVSVAYSALQTSLNIRATVQSSGIIKVTYFCSADNTNLEFVTDQPNYVLQGNICGNRIVEGSGIGTSATPNVYAQIGWSLTDGGSAISGINSNADITLYPAWSKLFTYSGSYQVAKDGDSDYRLKFLNSGNLIWLNEDTVDLFALGGGGGGASSNGAGGGGGYTTTMTSKTLTANTTYAITVGAGGSSEADGSRSSIAVGGNLITYADGGVGGTSTIGGEGGSGGGTTSDGGINGGNGVSGSDSTYGMGQGYTTCEFGYGNYGSSTCEYGYTLYAAGGSKGSSGLSGAANTGNGGSGGSTGGSGGSGIVEIQNNRATTADFHAFKYTGDIQSMTLNSSSTCELKVWGAEGGQAVANNTDRGLGGEGGYSTGNYAATQGSTLYVAVGGKGGKGSKSACGAGGYNGGGKGTNDGGGCGSASDDEGSAGGGGATHIATATGLLSSLSSNQSSVLIVAGGGGGASYNQAGGNGGGTTGANGINGAGGTQTTGYAFGQGQDGSGAGNSNGVAGGGGGWYGGQTSTTTNADTNSAGGGSGYIGGVVNGTTTQGGRLGNGFATISCHQQRTFTLTYNNNGGSGCTSKDVLGWIPVGTLCAPTKQGYIFIGWYDAPDGGNIINSESVISSNKTVYAQYVNNFTYTGDYTVDPDKGYIYLTSSGDLTLPETMLIDVHLVGGGGGGGRTGYEDYYGGTSGGGGGGGGYTASYANVSVTGGVAYPIVVGAGGAAASTTTYNSEGGAVGGDGEASTAFGYSAAGGLGGNIGVRSSGNEAGSGGDGGSGGGGGSLYGYWQLKATPGGSDGSSPEYHMWGSNIAYGGTGQGTSTRDFYSLDHDETATLRAGGGGGAGGRFKVDGSEQNFEGADGGAGGGGKGGRWYSSNTELATPGEANTGGGGGGGLTPGWTNGTPKLTAQAAAGGSGVVIIRRARYIDTSIGAETATSSGNYKLTYVCTGGNNIKTFATLNSNSSITLPTDICGEKIVTGDGLNLNSIPGIYYQAGWSTTEDETPISSINVTQNTTLYSVWRKKFEFDVPYSVINDGGTNWKMELKETGNLNVKVASVIDVHLVGGGGGGGRNGYEDYYGGTSGGGGGGGGYTRSEKNISLSVQSYSIVVGEGGAAASTTTYNSEGGAPGGTGGTSTAFGYSAAGGQGGTTGIRSSSNEIGAGGDGGSGGGGGSLYGYSQVPPTQGGSNGNSVEYTYYGNNVSYGGTGQGTSTRDFYSLDYDETATLRAGGGGGAGGRFKVDGTESNHEGAAGGNGGGGKGGRWYSSYVRGTPGTPNTGGGGGGGLTVTNGPRPSLDVQSGAGGSGVVIIRNARYIDRSLNAASATSNGSYTITYKCEGGNNSITTDTVSSNSTITLPTNVCGEKIIAGDGINLNSLPGIYYQAGWSIQKNGEPISSLQVTQDTTLYSVWRKKFEFDAPYAVINEDGSNWRMELKETGNLDVKAATNVDVHLVGGGGGGARSGFYDYYGGTSGGGGGGGGYTTTQMNVSLSAQNYSIVIGAGGAAASTTTYDSYGGAAGGTGGTSTAFGYSAAGGLGGTTGTNSVAGSGGNGGSGGGAGSYFGYAYGPPTVGASDGGTAATSNNATGGTGQGTTTRDFGEVTGTLRSGGGGGAGGRTKSDSNHEGAAGGDGGGGKGGRMYSVNVRGTPGTDNYGGGGGGGITVHKGPRPSLAGQSGEGGSGIVIIRNHR